MDSGALTMKFFTVRWLLLGAVAMLGFTFSSCSRLLPARSGEARSYELILDTRRVPSEALSGCYIPEVFPGVSKVLVDFIGPIPPKAVFKSVRHEVVLKNEGPMAVLEPVIENNKVYLKFAVPAVDSFTQYHVVVWAKYEYR